MDEINRRRRAAAIARMRDMVASRELEFAGTADGTIAGITEQPVHRTDSPPTWSTN